MESALHPIFVECYSGYRADERPVRFSFGDVRLEITSVDDRWYSPDASYFRVLASDGNLYVLRHDHERDCWAIDAFRARGLRQNC
jgi:hypothetical protein